MFKYFINLKCVLVCTSVCGYVHGSTGAQGGWRYRIPRAGVTSNHELTNMGAGTQILVLCKSSLCSQPLCPLSSPGLVFHMSHKTTELSCPLALYLAQ